MTIEAVLDRLGHVRQSSKDSWMARCPAHEDGSASLSVRVLADGKVLLNDFAGCTAGEIVEAIGLRLIDLYPLRDERHRPLAARWQGPTASQALVALAFEVQYVGVVANDLAAGKAIDEDDRARLWTAIGRIGQAQELCRG